MLEHPERHDYTINLILDDYFGNVKGEEMNYIDFLKSKVAVAKYTGFAEYTRGQWQLDAHAYWRSSGNTLLSKEQMKAMPIEQLQRVYHEFSKGSVYDFAEHVRLVEELDNENRLPASFMVCSPAS